MRVSFYTTNFKSLINYRNNLKENNNPNFLSKPKKIFNNFGLSLGVGVTMGGIVASVMRYKKLPNIFKNSVGFGSVFSYLTYMGTYISTPFRVE